ncbi:MAG: hypothetical protein KC620_00125 [Myxococcales bacterium]|nr:hypothetical protein [Myxococcales bacterium]
MHDSLQLVIADLTIWAHALDGTIPRVQAAFHELRRHQRVTAPGMLFAQLLSEVEDDHRAERVRTFAIECPTLPESQGGWLAAGDIGFTLRERGLFVSALSHYLLALCIREGLPLWTLDDEMRRAAQAFSVPLYDGYIPSSRPPAAIKPVKARGLLRR